MASRVLQMAFGFHGSLLRWVFCPRLPSAT